MLIKLYQFNFLFVALFFWGQRWREKIATCHAILSLFLLAYDSQHNLICKKSVVIKLERYRTISMNMVLRHGSADAAQCLTTQHRSRPWPNSFHYSGISVTVGRRPASLSRRTQVVEIVSGDPFESDPDLRTTLQLPCKFFWTVSQGRKMSPWYLNSHGFKKKGK